MAEIRKIVRSNPLSNFQNVAPSGGGAFELMALAAETAYERLAPAAMKEQEELGAQLGRDMARSQMGDPQGTFTMSTMAAPTSPGAAVASDAMTALGRGHVRYANDGKIRDKPLSADLERATSFLSDMGITMEVFSGGQDGIETGGRRTGSTRHDHGNAADVFFYKDGRRLDWSNPDDVPLFQEIVRQGRAAGITGFGAGPGYMQPGSMHIGFGAPAIWGAGGDGANAPGWLREAYEGAAQGAMAQSAPSNITVSSMGSPEAAPVMVRGSDGRLTARLYSPLSGPILQAHNAAAGVAYLSEVTVKGTQDLMSLSEQFALNPEGFTEAARGYVDDLVAKAPDMFRGDVRAELEQEVQRRMLGMVEERHRETRQRAANSNQALIEQWSDQLSAATVAGDPDGIAAAEGKLGAALRARETLPGLAWTPEQSANAMRRAREEGMRRVQQAQGAQSDSFKADLKTIIKAAQDGTTAAAEGILDNPLVGALHPELYREATAFVTLRDQMPSFLKLTPAEQKAALAELRAQPVQAEWELDLYDAAEKTYAANVKAWEEDPIKRAGEVMPPDQKPPALPQFDPNNPQAFISGMAARAEYANSLVSRGYSDRVVFVDKQEAQIVGAMFDKSVPPELKTAGVAAIVQAMGKDAGKFLNQISTADQGVKIAGNMLASGVNPAVANEVIVGQSMLDSKMVEAPKADAVRGAYDGFRLAIEANPMMRGMEGQLRDAAVAIYAARVPANAGEREQREYMQEAWQRALGQSSVLEIVRGGVQDVAGNPAWLSPTMEGAKLDSALRAAMGAEATDRSWWNIGPVVGMAPAPRSDLWSAAADGAVPWLGGAPLDPNLIRDGKIILTPVGGTRYALSVKRDNGSITDVGIKDGPPGAPFIFDAEKLVDAARAAQ
jgi:hypothetical protein